MLIDRSGVGVQEVLVYFSFLYAQNLAIKFVICDLGDFYCFVSKGFWFVAF